MIIDKIIKKMICALKLRSIKYKIIDTVIAPAPKKNKTNVGTRISAIKKITAIKNQTKYKHCI